MARLTSFLDRIQAAPAQAAAYVRARFHRKPRPGRRVKTPTILQMEAVECGAAALAMVLAYYGRYVPLEVLRVDCGVSRDGSKANNMAKAARRYGLLAKGFRKEPAALRELAAPMIIHWNFNHFVVFEGFKNGKAYLNDPAMGPRVVTEDEFDQSFTGVVLLFEPGPDFARGGNKPNLIAGLKPRLAGSESALAFVVLVGLALVIPGLVIPIFSKVFVDNVLIKQMDEWAKPLLVMMGVTVGIFGTLVWLQQRYLLRMETKIALSTSSKFFWHVLRLPIEFFSQRYGGEIGSRVGINNRVAALLSGELATTILSVIVIAFYALLMFQYDVVLTLIGVVVAALNIVALKFVSRKRKDLNRRMLQEQGKLIGTTMGGLQMVETLKATGSEGDFFTRWGGHQAKAVNAHQQLGLYTQVLGVVPPFLMAMNVALLLGVGGLRIMDGNMSIGMLIAFQALMISFITPVDKLVQLGSTLQEVEGDMNRIDDVLQHETAIPVDIAEETALPEGVPVKLSGHLELRHVDFGYSRLDPPLIKDFNLTLRPGTRVALVGGSGCGKSTLARLVCGLYEPWRGEILFDGKTRDEIPRSVMNNAFAVVDQDIFLFEGTVRDNLTLWDETIPEEHVIRAAKDARIHSDVTARPHGYEGAVGEGGRNFSGGQRQRLEIARALVKQPTMLVLDEATSALDPTTEQQIDDNFRRRGCTCLIIAHRLSTIRDCDEIIVLDAGQVVQRGTHDELIAQDGPYARLLEDE